MADRKPLVVLAVLGVLAVALFVAGVLGTGRTATDPGWPSWATPQFAPGDPLPVEDLSGSSGCSIEGAVITFTTACRVEVARVTGGWPWQAATRRALLVVSAGPVDLAVTLAGKALRTGLDPGEDVRLTYTRDGGDFALACGSLSGCAVVLTEDS